MKISICKYCGAKISLFARTCPECGARVFHPIFGIVVALILALIVFSGDFIDFQSNSNPQGTEGSTPQEDIQKQDRLSENLILGPGTYIVGEDIPSGKYDCIAASGFGVLRGEVASAGEAGFAQTMGNITSSIGDNTASVNGASSYSNLTLQSGDTIYIEMSLSVEFIPK